MNEFRCCALLPTYNNPATIGPVVDRVRKFLTDVIVVDDGSDTEGRDACAELQNAGKAIVVHRERNGGKGAAVKTGFEAAVEHGFTHVFQIDADGQHDITQMPTFLSHAQAHPEHVILGYPRYDESVVKARLMARKITQFWVNLETGGPGVIEDAMVGFRIYPLDSVRKLKLYGNRMDFDVEIAVRTAWAKIPISNLPVGVRYLTEAEGGRSHFQPLRDNLRLSWLHSRLCTFACVEWVWRKINPRLLMGNS